MRHVIYHTEYIDARGMFLREEEYDAYFNTLPEDFQPSEQSAFNGCRSVKPAHRDGNPAKGQLERLKAKKPGYEQVFLNINDVEDGNRAIYTIYEKMIPDEDAPRAIYYASVEIGEANNGVSFAMDVIPVNYELSGDEHITRWDGVRCEGKGIFQTGDWISICESPDAAKDKHVTIVHGSWSISGKWEKMVRKNKFVTEYHCRNSLFSFVITFNTTLTPEDWKDLT